MFFSVCIPVYNTSKYLEECVESVLAQTEKDYEIVLIDDGSTDDSGSICDRYAAQYANIRVIHKSNEGLMMTRRRGFKEAKGEFFVCLDSDDYLCDLDALAKIRRLIELEKCDLVVYDYLQGTENPEDLKRIVLFDKPDGHVFGSHDKHELHNKYLAGRDLNPMWIKAMSRNIVDIDVDYYQWQREICRGEDMFQSQPILAAAQRIGYIHQPLLYYRWTPGSISNNPKFGFYDAFKCIYTRQDQYIPQWEISDEIKEQNALQRIGILIGVIGTNYRRSKGFLQKYEWNQYVKRIGNDSFFIKTVKSTESFNKVWYQRVFAKLVVLKLPVLLGGFITLLDLVSRIRNTIKGRK